MLAIASKEVTPRGVVAGDATPYSKADECDLILNGSAAFLDPPTRKPLGRRSTPWKATAFA